MRLENMATSGSALTAWSAGIYDHIVERGSAKWNCTDEGACVPSPTGTQAVDRAALLLREVVHCPDPVTFTELTAATGLAKSTTSRLLMALERAGLGRRAARGKLLRSGGAAELPPGRLERAAPKTITSRGTLAADLIKVRSQGYALTD